MIRPLKNAWLKYRVLPRYESSITPTNKDDGRFISIDRNGLISVNGTLSLRTANYHPMLRFDCVTEGVTWFTTPSDATDAEVLRGIPQFVGGRLAVFQTTLTKLPKRVDSLDLIRCRDLRDVHEAVSQVHIASGRLAINQNTINWLHLLHMKHVHCVVESIHAYEINTWSTRMDKAFTIMNAHLRNGRDIIACQDELMEAGYSDLAQL